MNELRYAVVGHPIEHSRSPEIHLAFAQQEGIALSYERILAPLDGFKAVAQAFFAEGGTGLNITLPFKGDAYEFVDEHTERARAALAVNTISKLPNGKLLGDNTDGVGIVSDILHNLDCPLIARRVLILGAGGAVRGVLQPILAQLPLSVTIANRNLDRAKALVAQFEGHQIDIMAYDELAGHEFDVIINGTSSSLHNELPPIPKGIFTEKTLAYDMVYGAGLTEFLKRAQSEKAGILADGLGMLVEQAAASYEIWRGYKPETRAITNALREQLA
ncbi:MAG: shikimate dehydrogenase [Neisseriaceae bacterium]|nr:shikimate dehydrogenase [Neisseriaceae bacterium]